eukprot:31239-Pelagococcus_subviridis.AAC.7
MYKRESATREARELPVRRRRARGAGGSRRDDRSSSAPTVQTWKRRSVAPASSRRRPRRPRRPSRTPSARRPPAWSSGPPARSSGPPARSSGPPARRDLRLGRLDLRLGSGARYGVHRRQGVQGLRALAFRFFLCHLRG